MAALVLFDDGRFGLDDPISSHLPEWKEPKVSEGDKLVPARHPITPRMLMTQSSGLYYQLSGITRGGFGESRPNRAFQDRDRNSDGKLDRNELPAAVFDRLDKDKDKDGFVTPEELRQIRNRGN